MSKWFARLLCGLLAIGSAHAQPVTALPPASTPLSGTELFYLIQNGVPSQITSNALLSQGGCPIIGCTFTGPVAFGANLVSGSNVSFTGGTLSGMNIAAGQINSGIVLPIYGGTGVNNGSFTLSLASSLSTSGAYPLTLTTTGATNVTLPTSGTLLTATSPVTATGTTAGVPLASRAGRMVSPVDFGAACNGSTDDSTAFASWWAYLISSGVAGVLPAGTCKINSAQTWNMASRPTGVRVQGASMGATTLDLRGVSSGTPLLITGNGTALFYAHFSDFTVLTNIAAPGVLLGNSGLTDALNTFTFQAIEFKNAANNAASVALQLNGVYNSDFLGVVTNTGGGSTTNAGLGVSLQCQVCQFSRFQGSFSGANIGVHLTNGYSFGNVFDAIDDEVANIGVQIDSANANRNTFIGGTFVNYNQFNFTAGSANRVINPNISIYSGGTLTTGVTGLWLERPGVGVSTPSMAATGVATTNTTGRLVSVNVYGGTVTSINVAGSTYTFGSGSVIVQPGQAITINYSAAPSWTWVTLF